MSKSHCFALFFADLSPATKTSLIITDKIVLHRINTVLRLTTGERLIVFNRDYAAPAQIITSNTKQITLELDALQPTTPLQPSITIALPLLKKAALEEALYLATALGANNIQLTITEKTHAAWRSAEQERLMRIIIAAAEQAKQFALPTLHEPKKFEHVITNTNNQLIVADPDGTPLLTMLNAFAKQQKPLTLFVGPEGDFTDLEKNMLRTHSAQFVALTPTILRSEHALAVLLGACRSVT